jgi:ABC-type sugar transport system ATPase subunit
MNFFDATVKHSEAGTITLVGETLPDFVLPCTLPPGAKVKVGVRPEHLRLGGDGPLQVHGAVELVERLGEVSYAYARVGASQIIAEVRGRGAPPAGADAVFGAATQDVHLFDDTGRRIAQGGDP